MGGRLFFVYITTNKWHGVLYTGMTNDIVRRGHEHRDKVNPGSFTARYNCHILVYYEVYDDPSEAIAREKQIKAGSRAKKVGLIEAKNPAWRDLLPEIERGEWPW
jgi:putative endonuclease